MSDQKFPRRTLLKGALLGVAAVPVSALLSRTAAVSYTHLTLPTTPYV